MKKLSRKFVEKSDDWKRLYCICGYGFFVKINDEIMKCKNCGKKTYIGEEPSPN